MPARLLKTSTDKFSGNKLALMATETQGENFEDLAAVVANLGIAGAAMAVTAPVSIVITASLGLAAAIGGLLDYVNAAIDNTKLKNAIKKVLDTNATGVKFITKFYEWESGGGAAYTYYAEVEYVVY